MKVVLFSWKHVYVFHSLFVDKWHSSLSSWITVPHCSTQQAKLLMLLRTGGRLSSTRWSLLGQRHLPGHRIIFYTTTHDTIYNSKIIPHVETGSLYNRWPKHRLSDFGNVCLKHVVLKSIAIYIRKPWTVSKLSGNIYLCWLNHQPKHPTAMTAEASILYFLDLLSHIQKLLKVFE